MSIKQSPLMPLGNPTAPPLDARDVMAASISGCFDENLAEQDAAREPPSRPRDAGLSTLVGKLPPVPAFSPAASLGNLDIQFQPDRLLASRRTPRGAGGLDDTEGHSQQHLNKSLTWGDSVGQSPAHRNPNDRLLVEPHIPQPIGSRHHDEDPLIPLMSMQRGGAPNPIDALGSPPAFGTATLPAPAERPEGDRPNAAPVPSASAPKMVVSVGVTSIAGSQPGSSAPTTRPSSQSTPVPGLSKSASHSASLPASPMATGSRRQRPLPSPSGPSWHAHAQSAAQNPPFTSPPATISDPSGHHPAGYRAAAVAPQFLPPPVEGRSLFSHPVGAFQQPLHTTHVPAPSGYQIMYASQEPPVATYAQTFAVNSPPQGPNGDFSTYHYVQSVESNQSHRAQATFAYPVSQPQQPAPQVMVLQLRPQHVAHPTPLVHQPGPQTYVMETSSQQGFPSTGQQPPHVIAVPQPSQGWAAPHHSAAPTSWSPPQLLQNASFGYTSQPQREHTEIAPAARYILPHSPSQTVHVDLARLAPQYQGGEPHPISTSGLHQPPYRFHTASGYEGSPVDLGATHLPVGQQPTSATTSAPIRPEPDRAPLRIGPELAIPAPPAPNPEVSKMFMTLLAKRDVTVKVGAGSARPRGPRGGSDPAAQQ